ncbi:MAG: hypothetical protein ACREE9_13440 [Stellaceae bacterium]
MMAEFLERASVDRTKLARARLGATKLVRNWLRAIAEMKAHAEAGAAPAVTLNPEPSGYRHPGAR